MGTANLDLAVQVITILGGTVALVLALLQIVETYLDIGDRLRRRRQANKQRD